MSAIARGAKNAFRSGVRTVAVILILAISMGLGLSMLLANQAVTGRLEKVRHSVGTTISIRPAGAMGMQGGGEPLKTEDVDQVKTLAHIKEVSAMLSLILAKEGSELPIKFEGGPKMGKTNLDSSIDPGTLGGRMKINGGSTATGAPAGEFKLPVRLIGLLGSRDEQGQTINVTEGRLLKAGDTNSAVVGKNLATKNNLQLGSTFTAYDEAFTVVGIFDTGTVFGNDGLYIPLAKAQTLSEVSEITQAVATVDSVDNVAAAVTSIKDKLGADRADVVANEENALTAVESLYSVERVSMIGFVIALGAAAIVILLTMLMIVRERRREIGVLKAIGGSNRSIVSQFVTEALALVLISSAVGMGIAAASSNSIAGALVTSNTTAQAETGDFGPSVSTGGPGFKSVRLGPGGKGLESAKDLIGNVTTNVSWSALGYGLLAAIGIAIVGSAIPAWLVTKVRPAEVLRGE